MDCSLFKILPNTTFNLSEFNCTRDYQEGTTVSYIGNPMVQAVFYVIYTTIFVLGVFGNALVCYVVMRSRSMQTVTNFFIANLALSDILLCVFAVPFTPLYTFLGEWVFGSVVCHLVPYSQGVLVYISTLTLTSIAVDRYFVIIYPFRPRMKLGTCLAIIACIWAFALLATLPYGIFMELEDGEKLYCEEKWPSEKSRHVFGSFTTIMQFVVPFVIITLCYVRVSIKLSRRARVKIGAKSCRKEELERERKRRTNRMLIAMVAIFGCSWLPINLTNLVNDVYMDATYWKYFQFCFFIAHTIAVSSTCYNPFLYAWLNENFRKEFKRVLPCFYGDRHDDDAAAAAAAAAHTEKTCNGNGENMTGNNVASVATTNTFAKTSSSRLDLASTLVCLGGGGGDAKYDVATDRVRVNTAKHDGQAVARNGTGQQPPKTDDEDHALLTLVDE